MTEKLNTLDMLRRNAGTMAEQIAALSPEDKAELIKEVVDGMSLPLSKLEPQKEITIEDSIMGIAADMDAIDERVEFLEDVAYKTNAALTQLSDIILEDDEPDERPTYRVSVYSPGMTMRRTIGNGITVYEDDILQIEKVVDGLRNAVYSYTIEA